MRLDHIAYRTLDRGAAAEFFCKILGYKVDLELPEGFDIQFEDGTNAKCLVLKPPEDFKSFEQMNLIQDSLVADSALHGYHKPPEIFVSDGDENSIVSDWVARNGPGIHHLAYEVESVADTMKLWKAQGIEFTTEYPLQCPGLVQAFTKPNPGTGIIYEIIEREAQGFCKDNVRDLMNSTKALNKESKG